MDIYERFEKYNSTEFLRFERVQNKRSTRGDLHAFLLLDELFPAVDKDIVSGAEDGEIFLSIDLEEFHNRVTDDELIELIRCGVIVSEYECLAMFV
jgi:hypothetical protein